MTIRFRMITSMAALGACVVAAAPPAALALTPTLSCSFAKMHAALGKSAALNKCFRIAIASHADPDPACVGAVDAKFRATFEKIEAKDQCAAVNDADAIERLVDRFAVQLATALSGECVPSGTPCAELIPCCSGVCVVTELGGTPVCT